MFLKHSSLPLSKVTTACALSLAVCSTMTSSLALAQNISGKIVDSQGNAVSGANISINGQRQSVDSDQHGDFTLSDLKEGKFEIHTSADNYAHTSKYITVGKANVEGVVIQLSSTVMEVLDIYATPLHSSSIESALPVNVISGDDLKLKQASTLGETLKNEVGVHSNFYGGVTSSPIVRGLDGPRVLITQNGLDAGDASRVGADHAVSTETSTATQIEVLRGPSTLFYGSGAIGGVVNVVDNRIPTNDETMVDWLLQYNDGSEETQGSLSLQQGLEIGEETFAFHLDGFWRDAGNYTLPKDFSSHDEHEDEDHEDEDHEEHEEESSSTLANSNSKSSGFTVGGSYLFDQGFVGVSYGSLSKDYGIPGHAHHEEHEEEDHEEHEEGTQAKMRQDRVQVLSEVNFDDSFIKQLKAKFAYTDYQHKEIEGGMIGTTFNNESSEFKVDFYHQNVDDWKGAWTLHYKNSDFEAIGEEAFAPPSTTDSFAAAWLEEKHFGDVLVQLGARVEHVKIDAEDTEIGFDDDELELVSFETQDFTPISASIGFVWDYTDGYNLGLSLGYSQRAPSAAELFSFGPHIGTNTFEVGAIFELHLEDDGHDEEDHEEDGHEDEHHDEIHVELAEHDPEIETSQSIDLTWRKFEGDFGFVISAFYNRIDDFYFQQDTGLVFEDAHDDHEEENHEEEEEHHEDEHEEEGLPILVYQQDDVEMYGLEAEFLYQISSPLKVSVFGDYINAKLTNGDYLPRVPPMRLGSALHYQANSFESELSVNHYFEQDKIAPLETVTSAYTIVDFNFNYYLSNAGVNLMNNDIVLYVKGQNLTDELGFVHSSFLKDDAPLPGRSFSVGIRGSF